MNQNGTHQASVFYILADYTLGVGMFATLPGCYTVGVHDRCSALPVQFWLREGQVKHIMPGTGVIRGEVTISPEVASDLRAAMVRKGRCELEHIVKIYQGETMIAETNHRMGLYADIPRTEGSRATLTQIHNVKTSALMIAGLRDDDISRDVAQDQGVAIARRMTRDSPQLPQLIKARTSHIGQTYDLMSDQISQVVVLGAGLDPKPILHSHHDKTWFLCDLPAMLAERSERLKATGHSDRRSVEVALDFRLKDWNQKILASEFDPKLPSLIILEGVSMYLDRKEFLGSLNEISELMKHKDSALWMDYVTEDLMSLEADEVTSFLSSMQRLCEPFINPISSPEYVIGDDWRVITSATAQDFASTDDPVYDEYRFTLIRPR